MLLQTNKNYSLVCIAKVWENCSFSLSTFHREKYRLSLNDEFHFIWSLYIKHFNLYHKVFQFYKWKCLTLSRFELASSQFLLAMFRINLKNIELFSDWLFFSIYSNLVLIFDLNLNSFIRMKRESHSDSHLKPLHSQMHYGKKGVK